MPNRELILKEAIALYGELRPNPAGLPPGSKSIDGQRPWRRLTLYWCRSNASTTHSKVSPSSSTRSARLRRVVNPQLRIEGLLLTMYDERTNLAPAVAADLRSFYSGLVFETAIPRNVRLAEAPSHGKPVIYYDEKSRGAEAYSQLAKEIWPMIKRPLGRGLSALISTDQQPADRDEIREIEIDLIQPGQQQPRTFFDEAKLEELAQSIRTTGIIQPLLVRPKRRSV
jgi:hypothetical protein